MHILFTHHYRHQRIQNNIRSCIQGALTIIKYILAILTFGMTAIAAGSHPVPFRTRQ